MHVAITNPYVWPHVRRGSERLLQDLSVYLHRQGHRVSVHAMAPGEAVEHRDGVGYHLMRQRLGSRPRQFNRLHDFAWRLQRPLASSDADLVFCLNYFDAWAALRARARMRNPFKVVFMAVGIPTRRYFRAVPLDAWFMRRVVREADQLTVLSQFAQEQLHRDFAVDSLVLPPPVSTDQFRDNTTARSTNPSTDPGPRLLFVSDLDEPRKGARVLCQALPRIRSAYPSAQLVFAGRASEGTKVSLLADSSLSPADRNAIQFLGLGQVGDLPALYRSASVTVLPSVWEAYGLVLVESLAAGTPVVGTRHAGIPDVVQGEGVGQLFDPGSFTDQTRNARGLAEAVLEVLKQGKTPAIQAACRARAEQLSWSRLGPRYEQLLMQLVSS